MEKRIYRGGFWDIYLDFKACADRLPDPIRSHATPKQSSLEKALAKFRNPEVIAGFIVASEEKTYKHEPSKTLQDSCGAAFINSAWGWCGYPMAASNLGICERELYYAVEQGSCCAPDIWLKKAFFVPSSYWYLKSR
jgi:hypothetical protein